MIENIIWTKLKEFIGSKVELEKRLTDEFNLTEKDYVECKEQADRIGFVRELISELTDLVESINESAEIPVDTSGVLTTCIIGRVGLKTTTPDGGVIFRINTEGNEHIDFLYYGENRDVLAFGMKVYVSGVCGKNGTWTAQTVEIVD